MNNISIETFNPRMSVQNLEPGNMICGVFDENDKLTISDKYTVTVSISEKQ